MRMFHKSIKIIAVQLVLVILGTSPMGASSSHLAKEGVRQIKDKLNLLRLKREDLKLSKGWTLASTIRPIEKLFDDPLTLPATATLWMDTIETAKTLLPVFEVGSEILEKDLPLAPPLKKTPSLPNLPKNTPKEIASLFLSFYHTLHQAQGYLNESVQSLSKQEREGLLSLYEWPVESTG